MVSLIKIKAYSGNGKSLIPLVNKTPLNTGWNKRNYDLEYLQSYNGNLGWRLSEEDLVIDVDFRNGGEEGFENLMSFLNFQNWKEPLEKHVNTPSGGFHCYLKIPEKYIGLKLKKSVPEQFKGIDFITKGGYVVICGSVTEKGEYTWVDEILGGFSQNTAPHPLIEYLASKRDLRQLQKYWHANGGTEKYELLDPTQIKNVCEDKINISNEEKIKLEYKESELDDLEELVTQSNYWTEEQVDTFLDKLDNNMPNSEWVKVGMALKDWNPVLGLEKWENWSKGGLTYKKGETKKRWGSFDKNGGVTFGTIVHLVKEAEFQKQLNKVNVFKTQISLADLQKLKLEIIPKIQKVTDLEPYFHEILVTSIKERLKTLSGASIPVSKIREMLDYEASNLPYIHKSSSIVRSRPEWCEKWVYIVSQNTFYNIETLVECPPVVFNQINGVFVSQNRAGNKLSASKYVADNGYVECLSRASYLPNVSDRIITIDGETVLNTFDHSSIPQEAKEYTKEGLEVIETIKKHMFVLGGTEENAEILLCWIAHNIQHAGEKILWSPLIQSIEGIGKSYIGFLLRQCLGHRNVGIVSPIALMSQFNGWATNVCVNIFEEIRIKGRNRYDAVNNVKPLITDPIIQINEKSIKPYRVYNTTNNIAFTNYRDGLPISSDDRRWWVIFIEYENLNELSNFLGVSVNEYFQKLFDGTLKYKNEVRKWLLEYKIPDKFYNYKQAPMTQHKMRMIAGEECEVEGLFEARALLTRGGEDYNLVCLISEKFWKDFSFENPSFNFDNRHKNKVLKKLGFLPCQVPVKIDGVARRVWTKRRMTNQEIKAELKSRGKIIVDF